MYVIRSAEMKDHPSVLELARLLNSYNLPRDAGVVRTILKRSVASFAGRIRSDQRIFLFVAEALRSKRVVGCSLIIARHGTKTSPHLAFRLDREVKRSKSLRKKVAHLTFTLHINRTGFTEIGGLVLFPRYRHLKDRLGWQLSSVRFAFMARHRGWFRPRILVEYLPDLDPAKGNQFWNVLGRHFTWLRYDQADRLSIHNKEFILSLYPKEKIYSCLLPPSAIKSLGVPGPGAKASLHMLSRMGFRFLNQVDPFDGGPHYAARRTRIPLIQKTRFFKYQAQTLETVRAHSRSFAMALVMAEHKGKTRAVLTPFQPSGRLMRLPMSAARALNLTGGETVSVTPFR